MKSYNQRYKESGTTLSYKEWRKREDDKMSSFDGVKIPSPSLQDSASYNQTLNEINKVVGFKTDISKKTTLGIPTYLFIVGGLIIVGAIGYKIYKSKK
jgi:hypothetical protein